MDKYLQRQKEQVDRIMGEFNLAIDQKEKLDDEFMKQKPLTEAEIDEMHELWASQNQDADTKNYEAIRMK